ncbi:hypothetical protein A3L09_03195 [Thermococcus profundus]|uniref:KEOPS complex subunit Cgi121 n=1 Tax=Thermococcus profundus TaxID=49899 RepID=A0A2Z2MCM1_THEPR|nr:KEOPS complex subunit Cgi121 [Thermococcus profundus]ASJ02325.1 hypothetical protein A3L09_03195 [Thermococcus profundus]
MREVADGIVVEAVIVEDPEAVLPLLGGKVQLVRAKCYQEVVHAAILARRAFERKTNHAKTLGGELLLRLAGTLQISDAIKARGVGKGLNYLVVFGTGDEAEEVVKRLGLSSTLPIQCTEEEAKIYFEKSALVEVL